MARTLVWDDFAAGAAWPIGKKLPRSAGNPTPAVQGL